MWTLAKFVVVLLSVALSAVRASSAASHASTTTTPTPLTTSSPTPSTEPSDPAWRCGFEEDVCGMTQYEGEWTREDSLAPPPAAHGAWHVRVGDSVGAGASAGLQTPSFSPGTTARRCLAFYYYLDGADAGRLSVRLRLDGELQDPLWTRLSPAGQHWWAGHVDLLVNQSFSVAFEGTRGGSAGGLLALDEVALFDQPCTAVLHAHNPNVTFFCDLEEDLCGLTLEAEQGQWLWTSPQDPALAQYPHPALDHTYNTAHGKYLVAPLWDGRKGVVGRVVTEEFPQEKPQHQCLSFWYLHNGATHHDQLTVYLSHDHHMLHTAMWRESVNHQNTWLEANVPIPVERNQYAVVWEAKQNERHDQQGYMALDDMEILMQDCAHIGTCDFEVGTCGWQNLYVDNSTSQHRDVDWLQGSAAANTDHLTPFTDHNGNTTGKFLYVGAADGSVLGRAVLESQLLVPEQYNNFCFSFWFFLQGQATDSLWMEVEGVDAEAHLIWQQNASATLGQWQLGQVHVSPQHLFGDNSYQIFITGERGSEEGIIAVDDFNFGTQTFHCPLLPDQPTQGDTEDSVTCDFTVGTCGWQNVETESISWVYDGEKQEVHLELSDSATAGSPYIGQLRSPTFNSSANTTSCLSVTWFMEAETESQFSILVEDEDGSPKFYLMSVSTGSGGQLKTTNMEINQAGTLRIALQGTAIPPYVGTMSVNFVILKEKPCPGGVAGGNLWCDFEDPEECGFSNSQLGDDAQWTWGDILPPIDHTLSSSMGHNMFVDIANVGKNKIAHLVTPDITPVDPTFCATFWFYLTGNDVGRLTVYAVQNGVTGSEMWAVQQSFSNSWHGGSLSATVELDSDFAVCVMFFFLC